MPQGKGKGRGRGNKGRGGQARSHQPAKAAGTSAAAHQPKKRPLTASQEALYKELKIDLEQVRSARTKSDYIKALKAIQLKWCKADNPDIKAVINCRKKPRQLNLLTAVCLHYIETYNTRTESEMTALLTLVDELYRSGIEVFAPDDTGEILRIRVAIEIERIMSAPVKQRDQINLENFMHLQKLLERCIDQVNRYRHRLTGQIILLYPDKHPTSKNAAQENIERISLEDGHQPPVKGLFFIVRGEGSQILTVDQVVINAQGDVVDLIDCTQAPGMIDAILKNDGEKLDTEVVNQDNPLLKQAGISCNLNKKTQMVEIPLPSKSEPVHQLIFQEAMALSSPGKKEAEAEHPVGFVIDPAAKVVRYPYANNKAVLAIIVQAIQKVSTEANAFSVLASSMGGMLSKYDQSGGGASAPKP